jgi:intracellular multiplication protein IcmG
MKGKHMSDNKNINDEYQYVEESNSSDESPDVSETSEAFELEEKNPFMEKFQAFMNASPLIRNSVIVVIAIIILALVAKCSGTSKDLKKKPEAEIQSQQALMLKRQADSYSGDMQTELKETSQILESQKTIQANIASLSQQVSQLSSQVNAITSLMQTYPQDVSGIQTKLTLMEQVLQELKVAINAKKVSTVVVKPKSQPYTMPKFVTPSPTYYIQAIIPGRAWLISSNGSTLTVTVGTRVPGYGVVEKIHALQGVVEVSSNRVLRFNQRL